MDDDDEEDDELDWEEGAAELIERKSTYEGPTAKELESNRRLNELMKYAVVLIGFNRHTCLVYEYCNITSTNIFNIVNHMIILNLLKR